MLLRTTRRLSTFSRTALEGNLARREASSKLADTPEPPKLSRADAIEGRLARREAAALLQGQAEAASLTRAEMIEGRLARREAAALVQSLEASPRPNLSRNTIGFIGCGAIAKVMARAAKAVRPDFKGVCYAPDGSHETFAAEMSAELGVPFTASAPVLRTPSPAPRQIP